MLDVSIVGALILDLDWMRADFFGSSYGCCSYHVQGQVREVPELMLDSFLITTIGRTTIV